MKATIFADASFCSKTGAAGWGAWIISDDRPSLTIDGPIDGRCECSAEAEMVALANAMLAAQRHGHITHHSYVVLQSDCQQALMAVRWAVAGCRDNPHPSSKVIVPRKAVPLPGGGGAAIATVRSVASDLSLTLTVRHVQGHKMGPGRQWVNRACDAGARKNMEEMRVTLRALA